MYPIIQMIVHGAKRLILIILFVFAFMGCANAYDSLKQALALHQASQYQKALPIFINLSRKYKTNNEAANYAICQIKIADIIRNYGGVNLAIEMLIVNERFIEVRLEKLSPILAQNYIVKGEALYSASKLTEFKQAILKSISIKRMIGLEEKYLAEDYLHLARYYKEFLNQSDSCFYWVTKSLKLAKSDKSLTHYLLPRIYAMVGYHFHPGSFAYFINDRDLFNKHIRISRKYYDSALYAVSKQPIMDELMLGKIYHNLGNSYNNQYQDDLRKETMNKAMSFYKMSMSKYEVFGSPSELAIKDWIIGKGYERLRMNDSAINQFQIGLERLEPSFRPNDVRELPPLKPTLNDQRFISLIIIKANNFYFKYVDEKSISDLKAAYQHYEYVLKFHRFLLSRSLNESEAINWSYLYGSNAYQQLLNTAYELFRVTGDKDYLTKSYGLVASAKYAWLNRNDVEPNVGGTINSSILIGEIKLVKTQILKSIPSISSDVLDSILPSIPSSKNAAPSIQLNLASFVLDTISIEQIKLSLSNENAALIDFYVWGKELCAVIITGDMFEVIKQTLPPDFDATLWNMRKHLLETKPEQYARLSNSIYRETLDSALLRLPTGIDKLIICPDGQLQLIPWDALVVDKKYQQTFRQLNYLINRFTIRTVLTPRHLFSNGVSGNGYYGISPGFNGSKRFAAIPFSNLLVREKASKYGGEFRAEILDDSLNIGIFHIASHVVSDSLRPYRSAIYFNDTDSITIAELSNSMIRPQLAILNGCQTGNGTYYQSEGTVSLARAFYNMGAQSVLMTLWSVDDKTTAEIIRAFYDEIEMDNPLDASIRKAKMDFIVNAQVDELANPYYWAGLQLSGKAETVNLKLFPWIRFLSIAGSLFILLLLYILWRRKIHISINRF